MKLIAIAVILLSIVIGAATDSMPANSDVRPFVALAWALFLLGIFTLVKLKYAKLTAHQ